MIMKKCICGESYISDGTGQFCPHCFPTREGMAGIRIGLDEVFENKRVLLFSGSNRSKLIFEIRDRGEEIWTTGDALYFESAHHEELAAKNFEVYLRRHLLTDVTPVPAS